MASIPIRQRIRSAIGGIVRRRLLKSRDRFLETAQHRCEETQARTLSRILKLNADSQFSRQHGLKSHLSVADYQKQFPVSTYDTFRSAIDQMVAGDHQALLGAANPLLMYALTSGTTSSAKRIPVTKQFVKDYRRGWQHWGISIHEQYPEMKLRKMVQLISHHDVERTASGIPCGNISGLVTAMQSPIIRKLYTIPWQVSLVDDPLQRRILAARYAVADPWAGMFVTANPSSLISLLNTADENAESIVRDISDGTALCAELASGLRTQLSRRLKPNPERGRAIEKIFEQHGSLMPQQLWPNLCVLGVWTGGSVSAYLPELKQRFGNLPIRDHGLHASEGRMTIPIQDDSSAGILDIDSHFFEFIAQPITASGSANTAEILQAHQLEVDGCYEILLTTSSGLYRYNIHDVVRCRGFYGSTPLLEFLHKAAHISSITGEKITESQVVSAVTDALTSIGYDHRSGSGVFTMTPSWADPPGYQLFVSHQLSSEQVIRLAEQADRRLAELNCEYDDKRRSGRLHQMVCQCVTGEQWRRFTESRLRHSGGSQEQYKHPFLLPDPKFEHRFKQGAGIA
ncbi:MAG: GH3 auxin-responsive promoter family protein [Fuerstiella sp.]